MSFFRALTRIVDAHRIHDDPSPDAPFCHTTLLIVRLPTSFAPPPHVLTHNHDKMAPKKKGNKKAQQDDWEAELGETIDPIAQAEQEAKDADAAKDAADDDDGSAAPSGLMAALKRRQQKKGKKGKQQDNDWEAELGEDPTADADGTATPPVDLAAKAPEEANMDDEDLFDLPTKKGKGGKGGKQQQQQPEPEEDDDEEAGGRVKTKKEKEKEKKEREKQRKKEQVSLVLLSGTRRG